MTTIWKYCVTSLLLLSMSGAVAARSTSGLPPLSVLDMLPQVKAAAEKFLDQKEKSRRRGHRRQLKSGGVEFTDIGDNADEEIIDPSMDMPDIDEDDDSGMLIDPIKDESSECVSVLMDITNNFMSYNDTVLHIFRNSGKDYNDFGRYEDCGAIHHFNYFMITILKKFPIPFTMGLCLPNECSLDDLNDFKPFLTEAINDALPNMFEDVKGFSTTPTI